MVRVLDFDERGPGHHRAEEALHRLVQLRAPVLLGEHVDLGRRIDAYAVGSGDQRQPRLDVGRLLADGSTQARLDVGIRRVARDLHHLAQQVAPHRVRRGRGVGLAGVVDLLEADGGIAGRLEQTGLAHARLSRDLDQMPRTRAHAAQDLADDAELVVAAGQRELLQRHRPRARALRTAERPRVDGLGLALDRERLDFDRFEQRVRALEHRLRRVGPAGLRLGHHTRGEVHRVAHHRERAAVGGADVAGEHRAAVDADLHRQRQLGVEDAPHREQHALLVVARDLGRAGGEYQLAAVAVEVGGEQRHVLRFGGHLHHVHQLVQRVRGGIDALLGDQCVDALVAQEGDRHRPVFRRAGAREHVAAHRRRQAVREPVGGHVRARHQRQRRHIARGGRQESSRSLGLAQAFGREPRGGLGGEQDLAGAGCLLHRHQAAPAGTGGQQLRVRRADREEVELPRVHALGHLQRDLGVGQLDAADVVEDRAHHQRRVAGALDVGIPFEPEEQRVAAELEQAAAAVVGHLQDGLEALADDLGDLLRALLALAGELLGKLGEARDVDERRGALDRPAPGLRVVDQVLLQDPRNVEVDPLGAAFGVGRGGGRRGRLGGRRRGHGAGSDGFCEAPMVNRRGGSGGVNRQVRSIVWPNDSSSSSKAACALNRVAAACFCIYNNLARHLRSRQTGRDIGPARLGLRGCGHRLRGRHGRNAGHAPRLWRVPRHLLRHPVRPDGRNLLHAKRPHPPRIQHAKGQHS